MTVPIKTEAAQISPRELADLLGRWPAADGPLYRLLAARIGRLADTGELPAGIRLPPERPLAAALSVSRNTVALAYQVLRDDGMAESRQGSATRLVPHRVTPSAAHRANGFFTGLLDAATTAIDLSMATVDCAPVVAEMLAAPATVLSRSERTRLTSGSGYVPYGWPTLRSAVADMLTATHAIPTTANQVLVTAGAQQALDLLLRSETTSGQPVVCEDPTYPGFLDALHRAGARPVSVPRGDLARLAEAVAVHRPALVFLIPTFHNPTGQLLTTSERHEIVALARRYPDVTFIDDMTLAEVPLAAASAGGNKRGNSQPESSRQRSGYQENGLGPRADGRCADGHQENSRFQHSPAADGAPPLAALAPLLPNVVTVGSVSKTYWGGLRTGWLRAPEGIVSRLATALAVADLSGPPFQQAIVAALVRDRHGEITAWRRDWIQPRYEAMAAALRALLPAWEWTPPAGGLAIWARLPGDADSAMFAQAALRRGVAVIPGHLLSVSAGRSSWLRLAFTRPPAELTAAVGALASV